MTKLEQWMRSGGRVTDQDLANQVGVNRVTINQIKKGRRIPTLEVAVKLMGVTGLMAQDFLP